MKPIIFIPGIEATNLVDSNTFGFTTVWNAFDTLGTSIKTTVLGPYIEECLQENPLYDVTPEVIIERESVARFPYEKSIINLKRRLETFKQNDPIYLFGYDWRLSNVENGRRLKAHVDYLQQKLANHNVEGFRFLTHSMGALVFCSFLKLLKEEEHKLIDKVVLAAPPFLGAPYALIHMVKGNGGFKSFLNRLFGHNDDVRKIVRTYPSIFELLPFYSDNGRHSISFTDDDTMVDLRNINHWQSNVYNDIRDLFTRRLDKLAAYRWDDMQDLSKMPVGLRRKMVVVAGTDDDTPTFLKVDKRKNGVDNFLRLDRIKDGMEKGDGTVPFISSTHFKDVVQTIVVKKDNLLNELGDNIDFHGLFLRDSRVQNIVLRYFTTEEYAADVVENKLAKNANASSLWNSVGGDVFDVTFGV